MKKFFGEFKTFISRGNVMDLAVGVIIGGAFGKIVTSLVSDIIKTVHNHQLKTFFRYITNHIHSSDFPILSDSGFAR